ncbi:hypothetical protein GEMRC1_006933 [Eukaryota sp. GEM-RC1]
MISIRLAETDDDVSQAYAIRFDVFVDEQKVPKELELDEHDAGARHYLLFDDSKCIGTARLVNGYKVGRFAILKAFRRQGYGFKLLSYIINDARNLGCKCLELNAQLTSIRFYNSLGFKEEGEIFDDAGIDHKLMKLFL